ncbi:hypothetical protein [Lacinutrix sp. Hel_I_90]|uniref:hypothetical protein n=1 Tax=Lacinutrix sp. Hel_I_90 TaxID=1249999 RepID=UPI0005C9BCB2|nr:hypothetical protein [Lacinutrix sp. Hel_I_90]
MLVEKNKATMARIELQHHFCEGCSFCIKKELQKISNLSNIRFYPKESIVTFNFIKANALSNALNALSEIGYPEKGERINTERFSKSFCRC